MRVLVIGSGGREHAICYALDKSKSVSQIFVVKGNAGMKDIATLIDIDEFDNEKLVQFSLENKIDLTIVGPDAILGNGIVDAFQKNNLLIFGPTKKAALIETSKEYAKNLMKKYHIPTAFYEVFDNYGDALEYIKKQSMPIVIKYDGLAAGKGVFIPNNYEEAIDTLKSIFLENKFGKGKVVIEEFLEGVEFSYMCFVNGNKLYPMPLAQDHKRAYDHDQGPNTGGMGAYSPVDFIDKQDLKEATNIMQNTIDAMVCESNPFVGVLYGGLIKTKEGIKVIEFNARFGDPETEVVLPRLESDFGVVLMNVLNKLDMSIEWSKEVTLGVVLASLGYPAIFEKGFTIEGVNHTDLVFHMGTKLDDDILKTNGGRVLFVLGKGKTFQEAYDNAYSDVKKISCENLFYRSDIGHHMIKLNGGK